MVRILKTTIVFISLFLIINQLQAQQGKIVFPFPSAQENIPTVLSQIIYQLLSKSLAKAGFVISEKFPSQKELSEFRFYIGMQLTGEKDRLFLDLKVLDIWTGKIAFSDFSSLFAGFISEDSLDPITESLNQNLLKYSALTEQEPPIVLPVLDSFTLFSQDEDAKVWWNDNEYLGKITDGFLQAPYYPFASDGVIGLRIEKPEHPSRYYYHPIKPQEFNIYLPPLVPNRHHELLLFLTNQRGAQLGVGYRYFILTNWLYCTAELMFSPFQLLRDYRMGPISYLDVDFTIGRFLFFPEGDLFRFAVQLSIGLRNAWKDTYTTSMLPETSYYFDCLVNLLDLMGEAQIGDLKLYTTIKLPLRFGPAQGSYFSQAFPLVLVWNYLPLISLGTVITW